MGKISLCIVLPTKNESQNIEYMIKEIRKKYDFDLIVSDDNSTDGTGDLARSLGVDVFPRKSPGYGEGLKESLANAGKRGHTHMLIIDCDRTYSIAGIKEMFEHAEEGYDLINGGRRLSDIKLLNRIPNWFHTTLVNIIYNGEMEDVNSGMKLFRIGSYLDKITASGPDSTVQTVIIALKKNYRIKELMIPYNDRHGDKSRGRSKIKYRDGIIITWRIIKEKFI